MAAVVAASVMLCVGVAFADARAAESNASGVDAPAVVIDGPVLAQQPVRTLPLELADEPTPLPLVGIAAGLALLGVTLGRICIRRRALVAPPVTSVTVPAEVVLIPSGPAYLARTAAATYAQPEPAAGP